MALNWGYQPHSTEISRDEYELRRQIEEYYLPKQLIDAVLEMGHLPTDSTEARIGVAFMDIADYTYISKFLSPKENQDVLNGLYTAFNSVLRRHGGYLNKIEGDSLMFHYGGVIDPKTRDMTAEEAKRHIARELFYTCVEMQRVCVLFNQANDRFLSESVAPHERPTLERAFQIISSLRTNMDLASSINALFQIRIRIGANIGEVTIGNFGPEGSKQWDVVGLPVIEAKRMESTAPAGGVRISARFYEILEETGVADAYFQRFKKEADALFGYYRDISKHELFRRSTVRIADKNNAEFDSYTIQVNPGLPEAISSQAELLLRREWHGARRLVELIQYYRGNRFVLSAIEDLFRRKGIQLRKRTIFETINPKKYDLLRSRFENNQAKIEEFVRARYSLFDLLSDLGKYQDTVKQLEDNLPGEPVSFRSYAEFIERESKRIIGDFERRKDAILRNAHFHRVVFPTVFHSIFASIVEYQNRSGQLEQVE